MGAEHRWHKRGQGAFVVAQWPEPRVQQWEILLKARAVENQAFVVAVNRVGAGPDPDDGLFRAFYDYRSTRKCSLAG